MIVLALALTGCGIGTPRDDRDARRPLEVPVTGPSAYVILTAADIDRGWDLLEVMNIELPPVQRSRIQARDLVSGGSPSMMIRLRVNVPAMAVSSRRYGQSRHDVRTARCAPTLPER
jgi:hypothetical protein